MNLTISHLLLRKSLKASPFITASASLFSIKIQNSKNSHFLSPFYFSIFPLYQTTFSHSLFTKFLSSVIIDKSASRWCHFSERQTTFSSFTIKLSVYKNCTNIDPKLFANSGGAIHIDAQKQVYMYDNTFIRCTCKYNDCGAVSCKCTSFQFYYNCANDCHAHAVHTVFFYKYQGTNVRKTKILFNYNAFTLTDHPGHALLLLRTDYMDSQHFNISQNNLRGKQCAGIQLDHLTPMQNLDSDGNPIGYTTGYFYQITINYAIIMNNNGGSIFGYFSKSQFKLKCANTYFYYNEPDNSPYFWYITIIPQSSYISDFDSETPQMILSYCSFKSESTSDLNISAYKEIKGVVKTVSGILSNCAFSGFQNIFINKARSTPSSTTQDAFPADSSNKDLIQDLCYGTYFFTASKKFTKSQEFTESNTLIPRPTAVFTPSHQPQNGLINLFNLLKRNRIQPANFDYSDEYDD